jgi:hypothetical protein
MKTSAEIIQLANLGINLIVDAATKSDDEIMQIVYIVNARGTHLTLLNAGKQPIDQLRRVSEILKGHLTVEFRIAQ